MAGIFGKCRDMLYDFRLDTELFFDKIFKRHPKKQPPLIYTPSAVPVPSPATNSAPPSLDSSQNSPKADKKEGRPALSFGLRMLRLSSKDRLFFFDQMATLISSGVTLIDSLNLVRAQSRNQTVKKLYAEMIHHINAGMGLAEAMRLFPHIFPSMQAALIEAGEKSGNLKVVLTEIVQEMDDHQDFLRKVTGAMFYPLILIILAVTLVVGMMVFVIPRVAMMYEQARVQLPAITQMVINISGFLRDQWPLLLASIGGAIFSLFFIITKTRFGKLSMENFVSIIPMFGKISKEKNLMIIASNMGMLLRSGVLISDAFQITEKTVGNFHYQRALGQIYHGVIMGRTVSEMMGLKDIESKSFKEDKLFPLQFAQLIHIGETTGTMDEMLFKLRQNYHKSINYKLKNISTVVEPMMIMIVALLVGTILLAVMMPFFYIGTTIN